MLKSIFAVLFLSASVAAQAPTKVDTWKPLRYFVGVWNGTGKGEAGNAAVEREYKFALGNKFIQASHRSIYDLKVKNPTGSVHEDLGFFSYDKARKQFVFRQFNSEGFTVQFVVTSISDDGKTIVLASENNENIPKDMRLRVTYWVVSDSEFAETYEGAEPGKDFVTYYKKQFKRKKK